MSDHNDFMASQRSPKVKEEPSTSSDESDAPMSKRVRANTSKERSSKDQDDADPYDFPGDDEFDVKPKPRSPVTVLKRQLPDVSSPKSASVTPSNAPSNARAVDREDTEMEDIPGIDDAVEERPKAAAKTPKPFSPRQSTESADVVMEGTDEGERPLKGVKTIPNPPSTQKSGQKKSPEDQRDAETSQPTKSSTPPDIHPPLPPSPQVPALPLRKPNKLKRLRELHRDDMLQEEEPPQRVPTADEQARAGLRRALVLALDHVGFSSASNEALESFVSLTETYLQSLAEDVTQFAFAARRSQPLPPDFDASLARFNLRTSTLKPHLRNPVAKSKLRPTYFDPLARHPGQGNDLPVLAEELSGRAEKDAKAYIPPGFPDFPSIHTYRHTPVDVDSVTVKGSGLRYEDGTAVVFSDDEGAAEDTQFTVASNATTLTATGGGGALDGINGIANGAGSDLRSDPKRIREAAAVEAKQAEEALRGLMRASKINKLKEVRSSADRSRMNKQRFSLWEMAMRELIQDTKGPLPAGNGSQPQSLILNKAALREEIADQSMMVNAEKPFHRKEIPRISKKPKQKAS